MSESTAEKKAWDPLEELRSQITYECDQKALEAYLDERRKLQSFFLGTWSGGFVAVLCAILWAAFAVATIPSFAFMAIPLGALVGYSVRYSSNALLERFGRLAVGITLFGCLLGNLFTAARLNSFDHGTKFLTEAAQLLVTPSQWPGELVYLFHPVDLVFYALAGWAASQRSAKKNCSASSTRSSNRGTTGTRTSLALVPNRPPLVRALRAAGTLFGVQASK